jgi:hypothetical protein
MKNSQYYDPSYSSQTNAKFNTSFICSFFLSTIAFFVLQNKQGKRPNESEIKKGNLLKKSSWVQNLQNVARIEGILLIS